MTSGAIAHARLAMSGLDFCPVRPVAIERALEGEKPSAATFKAAAAEAAKLDAVGDAYVSAAYRQHLARVLTLSRARTRRASRAWRVRMADRRDDRRQRERRSL